MTSLHNQWVRNYICNRIRFADTLLEINGITLIKKWYNPVAPWYTIYGITNYKSYTIFYKKLYHI